MGEIIIKVNYIIDGVLYTIPTKLFNEESDEFKSIYFEVNLRECKVISKAREDIEYAIKYFQKSLPANVNIACCQSCRYGKFCPSGDHDNEIFCLKDMTPYNKKDVCGIFNNENLQSRVRKLLDYCDEYKPLCDSEHYTYNDWGLESLSL